MNEDHQAKWAQQEQRVRLLMKLCDVLVTFYFADDDPGARPDNSLYRRYTEYDRSTGWPDGIRDQRTQRVRNIHLLLTRRLIRCRMLEDLDRNVDRTDSKLSDAVRRMRKFVRETEGQFPRPESDILALNTGQKGDRDGVSPSLSQSCLSCSLRSSWYEHRAHVEACMVVRYCSA